MTVASPGPGPPSGVWDASPAADDTQAVRAAAQWLVAAAGAVGAALIVGLQIGDLGRLKSSLPVLVVAVAAFALAMFIVGLTIRRASLVLVVSKATVTDLLREETRQTLESTRDFEVDAPVPLDPNIIEVQKQITWDKAWLLPGDQTVGALFTRYNTAQVKADQAVAQDNADAAALVAQAAELSRRLAIVCMFARSVLTRMAYKRLSDTMTGLPAWIFTAAVITFGVALGWPVPKPPAVQTAYQVDILINGSAAAIRAAGLGASCLTGSRLVGVAVAGDLREPEVVTETSRTLVDTRTSTCQGARFTVTDKLGIPIPRVPAK